MAQTRDHGKQQTRDHTAKGGQVAARQKPPHIPLGLWILRVFEGILIGGGAILPGISGGVLAVSFGIYQPMMALFAHPRRNWRKVWRTLLPVGIGWAMGMVLFAKLVELLFRANATITVWLFIGLIAGTVPAIFRTAGKEGRGKHAGLAVVVSFILMLLFLVLLPGLLGKVTPSLGWYFFCGLLWGLSLVAPGMSSSSILIAMGLFEPMNSGVAALDLAVISPMIVGVALIVLVFARIMDYLFNHYYCIAYHAVLGVMLASTIIIIPLSYQGVAEVLFSVLAAGAGFTAAWWMEKYAEKAGI